jgi:hypothetical protein
VIIGIGSALAAAVIMVRNVGSGSVGSLLHEVAGPWVRTGGAILTGACALAFLVDRLALWQVALLTAILGFAYIARIRPILAELPVLPHRLRGLVGQTIPSPRPTVETV